MLKQLTLQQNPGFVVRQGHVRKPAGLGMGNAFPQVIWRGSCSAPNGMPDADVAIPDQDASPGAHPYAMSQ